MRESITVQLVSSLTRLDTANKEYKLFFVCSEPAESKLVKLETGVPTVILSPNSECSLLGLIKQSKTKLTVKKIIIVGLIN